MTGQQWGPNEDQLLDALGLGSIQIRLRSKNNHRIIKIQVELGKPVVEVYRKFHEVSKKKHL